MSAALERASGVFAALERLRNVSRLALVAIDRDDVAMLESCASETEALTAALAAVPPEDFDDREARGLLDDVRRMNDRIVQQVRAARNRAATELVAVGKSRARLAETRLEDDAFDDDGLDYDA